MAQAALALANYPPPLNKPKRSTNYKGSWKSLRPSHERGWSEKSCKFILVSPSACLGGASVWLDSLGEQSQGHGRTRVEHEKGVVVLYGPPKIGWPAEISVTICIQQWETWAPQMGGHLGPWCGLEQWNLILRLSLNFLPFIHPSLPAPSSVECLQKRIWRQVFRDQNSKSIP